MMQINKKWSEYQNLVYNHQKYQFHKTFSKMTGDSQHA